MNSIELCGDLPSPVVQDLRNRHRIVNGERQVEIRPAIAVAVRQPPDDSRGDDTRIDRRHPEHVVVHPGTVGDAEHERMVAERGRPGWCRNVDPGPPCSSS